MKPKKLNKDQADLDTIQNEYNMPLQRRRALKVLELAKRQEAEKMAQGARYLEGVGYPVPTRVLSRGS